MRTLYTRLALNTLIALSIVWFPWWLSLFLLIVLMALYRAYEALLWALLYDSLYGGALPALYGFGYIMTLSTVALFSIIELLKTRLLYGQ